ARVVELVAGGATVDAAMAEVGRSSKTYEAWRARDKVFAGDVDRVRADRQAAKERGKDPALASIDFETFRKVYLGQDTYPHHRAWIQAVERGDVDEDLPGQWVKGRPNRLLINTPPFHSKSTVITMEYSVY